MKNTNKLELAKRLSRIEMFHLIAGDRTNHLPFERLEAEIDKLLTQTQQDTLQWCLDEVVGVGLHFNAERVNGKWCFPDHPHTQLRAKENFQTSLVLEAMYQTIKKKMEGKE